MTNSTALLGDDAEPLAEYQSILTAIGHLPPRSETDPEKVAERQREKEVIKRRLAALTEEYPAVREFIEANVALFNGDTGRAAQLRPARRPAAGAGLSPLSLARGLRRDQLPAVLRHQRAGRAEHGKAWRCLWPPTG